MFSESNLSNIRQNARRVIRRRELDLPHFVASEENGLVAVVGGKRCEWIECSRRS
ncbi:MAG TPA: hypothetical protein V6D37_02040 [Candidatus Sericytochromatia bacterium]